jgi:hypothetical protein
MRNVVNTLISTHGKRPSPQNGRAFLSGNIEKELWGMEKIFQYHQQIFAGLELEIYNDLLKKDKIFLQCGVLCGSPQWSDTSLFMLYL